MVKILLLIVGTLSILTGLRVINWSRSSAYELFYSKWARMMIIGGPVLIILSIVLMFFKK